MLIDGVIALLAFQPTDTVPSNYAAYADTITTIASLIQGRVYEDELPRGFALPAVCVHQYGGSEDTDFGGPIGLLEGQLQFDCYAKGGAVARSVAVAIETLFKNFTGALPDGTVLKLCKLERSMAMPFTPNANQVGIANRYMTGFAVVVDSSTQPEV